MRRPGVSPARCSSVSASQSAGQPKAIMSPGSPGLYDQEFFDAVGAYADGFIYNLPWFNVKSQMTQALEASFKATNPKNRFDLDGFNAGFTFSHMSSG